MTKSSESLAPMESSVLSLNDAVEDEDEEIGLLSIRFRKVTVDHFILTFHCSLAYRTRFGMSLIFFLHWGLWHWVQGLVLLCKHEDLKLVDHQILYTGDTGSSRPCTPL